MRNEADGADRVTEHSLHRGTRQVAAPKHTEHRRGHIYKVHRVKKARDEQCTQRAIPPGNHPERHDGDTGRLCVWERGCV